MPGGWDTGAPWKVRDEEGRGEEEDPRTAVASGNPVLLLRASPHSLESGPSLKTFCDPRTGSSSFVSKADHAGRGRVVGCSAALVSISSSFLNVEPLPAFCTGPRVLDARSCRQGGGVCRPCAHLPALVSSLSHRGRFRQQA